MWLLTGRTSKTVAKCKFMDCFFSYFFWSLAFKQLQKKFLSIIFVWCYFSFSMFLSLCFRIVPVSACLFFLSLFFSSVFSFFLFFFAYNASVYNVSTRPWLCVFSSAFSCQISEDQITSYELWIYFLFYQATNGGFFYKKPFNLIAPKMQFQWKRMTATI